MQCVLPKSVVATCRERGVSVVVVGPEDPLADGLADSLNDAGIKVSGQGNILLRDL